MKVENYKELKDRQGKEINNFEGMFFAFNNEQFRQGMEKIGLTEKDTDKIYSLGAGGYILKDRSKAFNDMFKRHKNERKQQRRDRKLFIDQLVYELGNHEYCITLDPSDALYALGLTKEDVEPEILKKAISIYMSTVNLS